MAEKLFLVLFVPAFFMLWTVPDLNIRQFRTRAGENSDKIFAYPVDNHIILL